MNTEEEKSKDMTQDTPGKPSPPGSFDYKDRRTEPHWSLVVAALILFALLLYMVQEHLSPLTLALAILILLYPSRRTRELRPLLLLVGIALVVAIWWRLDSLLTPFIIAFVIAYALNPIVEWLESRKLPRLAVILCLLGLILGGMVGIGFLIVPRLIQELGDLAVNLPGWIELIRKWGENTFLPFMASLNLPLEGVLEQIQTGVLDIAQNLIGGFASWSARALTGIMTLISGIINLILIPILTIYFLNEFNRIREKSWNLVPERHKKLALELYSGVNRVLSGYLRGQMLVSLFLASWIGLGLWLVAGVPYALLLGISAGLLNLMPYIGTASALVLTMLVSLFQPSPIGTAFKALIVFVSAQTLEGNLITPRFVGDRVGLHPLVIIFLVLLFATLFGFIGLLVAIPVGASVRVMFDVWYKKRFQFDENIVKTNVTLESD